MAIVIEEVIGEIAPQSPVRSLRPATAQSAAAEEDRDRKLLGLLARLEWRRDRLLAD